MGDLAVRQPHLGRETTALLARIVASADTGLPQDDIEPYLLVRLLRCGYAKRRAAGAAIFVATPAGLERSRLEAFLERRRLEEEERRDMIRGRVEKLLSRFAADQAPAPPRPSLRDLPGYREQMPPPMREPPRLAARARALPPPTNPATRPAPEDALRLIREAKEHTRPDIPLPIMEVGKPPVPADDGSAVVHVGRLPERRAPGAPAPSPSESALPAVVIEEPIEPIIGEVITPPPAEAIEPPETRLPAARTTATDRDAGGGIGWKRAALAATVAAVALLAVDPLYQVEFSPRAPVARPTAAAHKPPVHAATVTHLPARPVVAASLRTTDPASESPAAGAPRRQAEIPMAQSAAHKPTLATPALARPAALPATGKAAQVMQAASATRRVAVGTTPAPNVAAPTEFAAIQLPPAIADPAGDHLPLPPPAPASNERPPQPADAATPTRTLPLPPPRPVVASTAQVPPPSPLARAEMVTTTVAAERQAAVAPTLAAAATPIASPVAAAAKPAAAPIAKAAAASSTTAPSTVAMTTTPPAGSGTPHQATRITLAAASASTTAAPPAAPQVKALVNRRAASRASLVVTTDEGSPSTTLPLPAKKVADADPRRHDEATVANRSVPMKPGVTTKPIAATEPSAMTKMATLSADAATPATRAIVASKTPAIASNGHEAAKPSAPVLSSPAMALVSGSAPASVTQAASRSLGSAVPLPVATPAVATLPATATMPPQPPAEPASPSTAPGRPASARVIPPVASVTPLPMRAPPPLAGPSRADTAAQRHSEHVTAANRSQQGGNADPRPLGDASNGTAAAAIAGNDAAAPPRPLTGAAASREDALTQVLAELRAGAIRKRAPEGNAGDEAVDRLNTLSLAAARHGRRFVPPGARIAKVRRRRLTEEFSAP